MYKTNNITCFVFLTDYGLATMFYIVSIFRDHKSSTMHPLNNVLRLLFILDELTHHIISKCITTIKKHVHQHITNIYDFFESMEPNFERKFICIFVIFVSHNRTAPSRRIKHIIHILCLILFIILRLMPNLYY